MRKMLGALLGAALAAGVAWADGSKAKGQPMEQEEARGTIQTIRKADNEIVLSREGMPEEQVTLVIDKETTINLDGQTASLADLKEGQQVRASWHTKNGEKRATTIDAKSGAGQKNGQMGLKQLRGTVESVKPEESTVTLADPTQAGKTTTLHVGKDTTIFIDGRTATLSDLKTGQDVRASYEMRGNELHANWIEVTTGAAPKPAEPQEPAEPKRPEEPEPGGAPY